MAGEQVLVTGAAGFIGMHVSQRLLADGYQVLGLDNLNTYYDPRLKEARLRQSGPRRQLSVPEDGCGRPQRAWRTCSPRTGSTTSCTSRRKPACGIPWSTRTPMRMPT